MNPKPNPCQHQAQTPNPNRLQTETLDFINPANSKDCMVSTVSMSSIHGTHTIRHTMLSEGIRPKLAVQGALQAPAHLNTRQQQKLGDSGCLTRTPYWVSKRTMNVLHGNQGAKQDKDPADLRPVCPGCTTRHQLSQPEI